MASNPDAQEERHVNDQDPVTLDVLEGSVQLLAQKERLELDKHRLQEIDRLKTEFLARVSHDLRTPLNSIIGFSELLISDLGGKLNKKQGDFVSAIHRNGYMLLGLITDLLDLATIETGQMTIRREQVPLKGILDDLRAVQEPLFAATKHTVRWSDAKTVPDRNVWLDRRRIVRAIGNLVDNARKFTPESGRIDITVEADDQRSVFAVADSGPGLNDEDRERLFSSFFQRSGPKVKQRGSGVGVGLAIVRGITELHGGSIEVAAGIGKGTQVRMLIPHTAAAPQP
jgi:signal transduction histidine kinase